MNTFGIPEWAHDEKVELGDGCASWCTALLYYVPAGVRGRWATNRGTLELNQEFQIVAGTLTDGGSVTKVSGKLRGTSLTITAGDETLTAEVRGARLEGATFSGTRIP